MKKEFEMIFKPFLQKKNFKEVLELVKMNSHGKIWITGGFIYRNIISVLYGTDPYEYDIDFVVEHRNKELKDVPGWNIEQNSYLNANYIRENCKMSFTDIHYAIKANGFRGATIEEFLSDTPLTIQAIAYDISENMLIGDASIDAIVKKIIKIQSLDQANHYVGRKGKTLESWLTEKADSLGFTVER